MTDSIPSPPPCGSRLVRGHRQGRQRIYQLNSEPLQAVDDWLANYRNFWRGQLADLKAYIETETRKEASGAPTKKKKSGDPRRTRQ